MTTMISGVYEAFCVAGVPEAGARKAAEALSAENLATKADIQRLENKFEKEILLLKWMAGLIIAIEVLPYLKSLL